MNPLDAFSELMFSIRYYNKDQFYELMSTPEYSKFMLMTESDRWHWRRSKTAAELANLQAQINRLESIRDQLSKEFRVKYGIATKAL